MIYTARELEQLHKANGYLVLPYHARLTPAAADWVRARKVEIQYSDGETPHKCDCQETASASESKLKTTFLWWCDGPCGAAKAAILASAGETKLLLIEIGPDPSNTASAVKHLAQEVKGERVAGGILAVNHGAAAMVMANRCASLRAVLGTCLDSVDQAVRRIGANVLVLEHAHRTLNEMRNMIRRFTTAPHHVPADVERQLKELAACG